MSEITQKLPSAAAGLAAGFASMAAQGGIDLLPQLVGHLVNCRRLGDVTESQGQVIEEVNEALARLKASYGAFDEAIPFLMTLSLAFCANFAITNLDDFLEMCVVTLEHAEFTRDMRAMLPGLRKNRELRAKLRELTQ